MKAVVARALRVPTALRVRRFVEAIPLIGPAVNRFTRRVLPVGERVWVRVQYAALSGRRYWLKADPRQEHGEINGTHEVAVQEFLSAVLRSGDCFYDVGAQIGFFSILAAELVGPRGSVAAFEPDPYNRRALVEALRRNGLSARVSVHETAVWSSAGTASFYSPAMVPGGLSTLSGVGRVTVSPDEGSLTVETVKLDEFVEGRRPPTVLKVDIEGGELEALLGSAHVLSTIRPACIIEVHSPEAGEQVSRLLIGCGYHVEFLDPRHLAAGVPRPAAVPVSTPT